MKRPRENVVRFAAISRLQYCGIAVGSGFMSLTGEQSEKLLELADRFRYQKPKEAEKSRLHCYFDMLQRQAGASADG